MNLSCGNRSINAVAVLLAHRRNRSKFQLTQSAPCKSVDSVDLTVGVEAVRQLDIKMRQIERFVVHNILMLLLRLF